MSRKAIVHIGSHKTGSTSIQKALTANLTILKEKGYDCFFKNQDGTPHIIGNINPWFTAFPDSIEQGFVLNDKDRLAREMSRLSGNTIISSESFSWIFEKEELQAFRRELSRYFDEIKIIVYIRRQDAQIISHHQQGSKDMHLPGNDFYGNEPAAIPSPQAHYRLYLDYDRKISLWADVFGTDNINVRVFDKKSLYKGDAVHDFFHLLGIEGIEAVKENVSFGFEKEKVGFLMNSLSMEGRLRDTIIAGLEDHGKLLPARDAAEAFYRQYRESNRKLNQKYHIAEIDTIFEEDFSAYCRRQ